MLVGGVLAIKNHQFEMVNGYSNQFWGWGGEDDDMAYRSVFTLTLCFVYQVNISSFMFLCLCKVRCGKAKTDKQERNEMITKKGSTGLFLLFSVCGT